MKFKVKKGLVDITGLTPDQFDMVLGVLECVDRQCFHESENDVYYSGSDFTLSISYDQRVALREIGRCVRGLYDVAD